MFVGHCAALEEAIYFVQRLPIGTVWSFTITNTDGPGSPPALNVFAEQREWPNLADALGLGAPAESGYKYMSWSTAWDLKISLLLSFIEEEDDGN